MAICALADLLLYGITQYGRGRTAFIWPFTPVPRVQIRAIGGARYVFPFWNL